METSTPTFDQLPHVVSGLSEKLDRWGRTLLNRREQIAATDEKRAVHRLTSFDYLMDIDISECQGTDAGRS